MAALLAALWALLSAAWTAEKTAVTMAWHSAAMMVNSMVAPLDALLAVMLANPRAVSRDDWTAGSMDDRLAGWWA